MTALDDARSALGYAMCCERHGMVWRNYLCDARDALEAAGKTEWAKRVGDALWAIGGDQDSAIARIATAIEAERERTVA